MANSSKEQKQPASFEGAFARLEELLQALNSEELPLEKALESYEEAETLLLYCNRQLNEAEKRIEILVKTREGELAYDASGQPQREPFMPSATR